MIWKKFANTSARRPASTLRREYRILKKSVLVDPVWYMYAHPDLRGKKLDAVQHYVEYGASERRDPHLLFDAEWYLAQVKDGRSIVNPVIHYLQYHTSLKLTPHPLFDPDWYFSQVSVPQRRGMDPLSHYLSQGWRTGLSPHPLFDPKWYRQTEAAAYDIDPLLHYLANQSAWNKSTHSEFDPSAYVKAYPEAELAFMSPLEHYVRRRRSEEDTQKRARREQSRHRAISEYETKQLIKNSGFFEASWYLSENKDVQKVNLDPLDHFVRHGDQEARSPGPQFDSRWYVEEYLDVTESDLSPLVHFLKIGRDKGNSPSGSRYVTWCRRFDELSSEDKRRIEQDIARRKLPPLNVIVLVENSSRDALTIILSSLDKQIYRNWRATVLIDNESSEEILEKAMLSAGGYSRMSIVRRQEFTLDNSGAGFSVIVRGDVALREHALYMFARTAAENTSCHLAYSDEDVLQNGRRSDPIFKPGYSPTLASQLNYFGSCVLIGNIRQSEAGVWRALVSKELSLEQALDAYLSGLSTKVVEHIPLVLYHNPFERKKIVKPVSWVKDDEALPSYTVIICTRNRVELLRPCIESIERKSKYPREKIEILVVDNGSDEKETLEFLKELSAQRRAKIIHDPGPFNFSALNNLAASHATNDILLFLNNDTIVEDELWLVRMATFVVQKAVGAVGGKLLYPDRTIQHGGVVLGIQGVAAHALVGNEVDDPKSRLDMTREMSSLTGACLAIRRELFAKLGGFDPVAAVAFNDTLLCLDALRAGYRNIYIKEPLLIHYESKSRGYDDRPERVALFRRETIYARKQHNNYFIDDPYYNSNLSLQKSDELGFPPRKSKPWRADTANLSNLKILFLSSTHEVGHGVPVVIGLQALYLRDRGHQIFVGGPRGRREMSYGGCQRVYLPGPEQAAAFAVEHDIDCIVVETPPFFSVVRWLADWPRTLFLDHGEPPAELFPDAENRRAAAAEKRFCSVSASGVFAISESVKIESGVEQAQVIPNGNSHLSRWEEGMAASRKKTRERLGWSDKVVVLNVCRFTAAERQYKGLYKYAEVLQEFRFEKPKQGAKTVFVICGKGEPEDVLEMKKAGFEVFANVEDSEMIDMYAAADIYANFSRWEGYNLGIGQALAMGLPVVASDIPAHRAFPIFTSDASMLIASKLADIADDVIGSGFSPTRKPVIFSWDESLQKLEQAIMDLCRSGAGSREGERSSKGNDHPAESEYAS